MRARAALFLFSLTLLTFFSYTFFFFFFFRENTILVAGLHSTVWYGQGMHIAALAHLMCVADARKASKRHEERASVWSGTLGGRASERLLFGANERERSE